MVVHAFIRFCMVLNPTMCQELEIAPADHVTVSVMECMRGVSMGNQLEFKYQGARWRIAGGSCRELQGTDLRSVLLRGRS
jgi:hypothetical protein